MHDRIFEISRTEIPQSNWMNENDLYDNGFIGSVADCISEIPQEKREAEISEIIENTKELFEFIPYENGYKIKLMENGKNNWFADRFENFKTEAAKMTLDDFCKTSKICLMRSLLEDVQNYYIYYDYEWGTLDEYIRYMSEGETYYIGGILDYHY